MLRDLRDQIQWRLRIGEPGPVERAAVAIAAQELSDTDVDLPTWTWATRSARDDAHARARYITARVAQLRRELRTGASPLLDADQTDRQRWEGELNRRAAALHGVWAFSLIYYSAVLLLILLMMWLATA